jgi:hypothetical protein
MATLMSVFARFRPDTTGFKQEAEAKLKAMNLDAVSGSLGKRAGAAAAAAYGKSFGDGVGRETEKGFGKDSKTTTASRKSGERVGKSFLQGLTGDLNTRLAKLNLPTLDLKANPKDALAAITLTEERLRALNHESATVEVKVDTHKALGELARYRKQLDDNAGGGAGRRTSEAFGKGFSDGGSTFIRVAATMASKMVLLGAAAASAAPGILQLTAALAPAAGILAAVPVAIGGMVAAMATIKIATAGVGKAIKVGLTGTTKQFDKALEAIPPAAQEFAKAMVALGAPLADLKEQVAVEFFAPFGDEVQPLAEVYLPLLGQRMAALAGPLGTRPDRLSARGRAGPATAVLHPTVDDPDPGTHSGPGRARRLADQ